MTMKIKIKFGIDFELRRVKNTLAKSDWYDSQGYKSKLPEGINDKSSQKEIQSQVVKEFDEKKYKERANQILSDFLTTKEQFSKKLKEIFNKDIPTTFFVYLTNYGVNGSYNLPNIIIFNINSKRGFKTIIHEIIHLLIEDWIQGYRIQHWQKERIVDLILNSKEFSFLEYNNWRRDYNGVEKYIDDLFNNHFFKDPKNFFSKIGNVRHSAPKHPSVNQ